MTETQLKEYARRTARDMNPEWREIHTYTGETIYSEYVDGEENIERFINASVLVRNKYQRRWKKYVFALVGDEVLFEEYTGEASHDRALQSITVKRPMMILVG